MQNSDTVQQIQNYEQLYRRVKVNTSNMHLNARRYIYHSEVDIEIRPPAFDTESPSVYLATLIDFDPVNAQRHNTDGVFLLLAGDVKNLKIDNYSVTVRHTPECNNFAHSEIVITPDIGNLRNSRKRKILRELRRKLAFIANQTGWKIKPPY